MPRTSRVAPGGTVFHVLNRGVARMQLFEKPADYQAFEEVLRDTLDESPMRICAYAVMPNHWHLLVWPDEKWKIADAESGAAHSPILVAIPELLSE
jgi:putative transposase